MTTLFDATKPVKLSRTRTFGRGVLRSLPTHTAPYTSADALWLAAEEYRRAAEDRHYDLMAAEAEAETRLTAGCWL